MAALKLGDIKSTDSAIFFMCDIQQRFEKAIKYFHDIVEVSRRLAEGCKTLEIPLVITEQYPKGLGSTVDTLLPYKLSASGVFEKTKFTMLIPEVETVLKNSGAKHVILFGIETHVCVQQTVIDLVQKGYEVHVVADATSSRSDVDRKVALQRFQTMPGVHVTTSEAVLLQLVGDKNHPQFKAIQQLIMQSAPETGLVSLL